MTEQGVVVDGHLGVEREPVALSSQDKGVDLGQRRVFVQICVIQLPHHRREPCHPVGGKSERKADLPCLPGVQTEERVDEGANDPLWPVASDLFDVDTALRARHDHVLATCAIQGDPEIDLLGDVDGRRDQNLAHDVPANVETKNRRGDLAGFCRCAGELDAACLAAAASQYLGFYDDRFEEFDMLTFPITYGTDVGESDEVEIIRVSPDDAVLLKGPGNGNTKLRGTKLGNFGAFFSKEWRENDMVWGRLDAAECLIKAVWSEDEDPAERDGFIRDAHKSIIEEFMLAPHRKTLMEKYLGITSDVKKKEVEEAISTLLGDKDKLVDKFLTEYKVNPNFPPESTLRVMARSTSVLGRLLGGLSPRYPVFSQPAGILTRLGRIFFGLVSVAISQSMAGMIFDNFIRWVYVLELLFLTVARIFIEIDVPGRGVDYTAWGTRMSRLGVQAVLYTFLINLAVLLFRTMTGREQRLTKFLRILLIILIIVLAAVVLILSYSDYF